MNSENKNPLKSKNRCTGWSDMPCSYSDMMKMMDKYCPGIKEKLEKKKGMQTMMDQCCGMIRTQSVTPSNLKNDFEPEMDRKDSNKCCS